MKVTIVPAQITTVEDRIAGNLGLSQLLLLAAPVFGGSALYVVLPPTMHSATYKLVVVAVLAFLCAISAIRIKGKILLFWLLTIVRYNLRPRYYLFNKNDLAAREQYETSQATQLDTEQEAKPAKRVRLPHLSTAEAARVLAVIENPAAHLSFDVNHKGGLNVRITEVKQQS
jgi:hypothetical protein